MANDNVMVLFNVDFRVRTTEGIYVTCWHAYSEPDWRKNDPAANNNNTKTMRRLNCLCPLSKRH